MRYTAEYQKRGQTGTGIVIADSIDEVFDILPQRGWNVNNRDYIRALLWDVSAIEGQKYYGLFNDLVIVKGDSCMTEYTSL